MEESKLKLFSVYNPMLVEMVMRQLRSSDPMMAQMRSAQPDAQDSRMRRSTVSQFRLAISFCVSGSFKGGGRVVGVEMNPREMQGRNGRSCLFHGVQLIWSIYFNFFPSERLKRGHAPPPFLGGREKLLVRHSKAMPKRGLNPENHVCISNGMVVTEMSIFTV